MKNNEIVIFEKQNVKLEVNLAEETVWLTREQMAKLFEKDRTTISRHIKNIFKEGELEEKSNVQKMHVANSDKSVETSSTGTSALRRRFSSMLLIFMDCSIKMTVQNLLIIILSPP